MNKVLHERVRSLTTDLRSPTIVSTLDFARWVAAGLVFIAHLRNPMFLGYGEVPPDARTWGVKAWYFLTGWHAEAVTVFFVLSGLLVGGAGLARLSVGKFDPKGYAVDRLTRLYLAFLPALVLGLALDVLGSRYLGTIGFWDHTHPMLVEKVQSAAFASTLTLDTFLGNLLMLQNFYVPPLGSNQPLWTISAEFWFYAVFLVAVRGFALARSRVARVTSALVLLGVFGVLGNTFLVLLGLWLTGVAIAVVPPPRYRWASPAAALALFAIVMIVARAAQSLFDANATYRDIKNYVVAITFALVIVAVRGRRHRWLERIAPTNAFLASFSYSLYLLHFPLMLFVLALFHSTGAFPGLERGFLPTDPRGLTLYAATILVVYVTCWLFSLATERHTDSVRRGLKQWLARPPSRPAPRY